MLGRSAAAASLESVLNDGCLQMDSEDRVYDSGAR